MFHCSRMNILLLLLLFLLAHVLAEHSTVAPQRVRRNLEPYAGYQTMRVFFKTNEAISRFMEFLMPDDLDFYASNYPEVFLTVPNTRGATEILLPRNATQRQIITSFLNSNRITFQASSTDFNSALGKHGQKLEKVHKYEAIAKITGFFPRYYEIQRWMRAVARAFPEILTMEQFGRSFEGRPIFALKIGAAKNRHKPNIFIESGMHGREWLAPATCIWIIDQVVKNFAYEHVNSPSLLSAAYNFVFVIMANPDGYEYSHTSDRLWRKTRSVRSIPVCADTSCLDRVNVTCEGVDGNRNWNAHFGEVGTMGDCRETYPGPHAFSEVEVRSLADYVTSMKTTTRYYISLHAFGQTWVIPPGHVRGYLRNHAAQVKYAKVATKAIKHAGGPDYTVGTHAELQYMVSGSSTDWAIENDIPFAATVNLSPFWKTSDFKPGSSSYLATADQVETCGKYFHAALRALANAMHADSRS